MSWRIIHKLYLVAQHFYAYNQCNSYFLFSPAYYIIMNKMCALLILKGHCAGIVYAEAV